MFSPPLKHTEKVDSMLQTSDSQSRDSYHEDSSESVPFLTNRHPQVRQWFHSPRFFVFDVLLVMICGYFVFRGFHKHQSSHLNWQGDVTGFVPPFSHQIVSFEKRPEFISNHTSEASLIEAREFWKTLVPAGQGFVFIDEKDARDHDFPKLIYYEIPPEEAAPGIPLSGNSLGTSIVHSLHCLYTIMAEYDLLAQGQKPFNVGHMDHCFDYIRQVIMCGGDMALAGENFPGGSNQFGVPHVCKNWDEIYQWLEKNRVTNSWQFGGSESHWVPPT